MITQVGLKAALSYDADTGVFRWTVSPCNPVKAGQIAGAKGPKGSSRIEFCEKNYLAHRLAWFYSHGEWPAQIDHILAIALSLFLGLAVHRASYKGPPV